VEILLDPTTAAVERVTGQTDDVEGAHYRDRVGDLLCCSGLEPSDAPTPAPSYTPICEEPLYREARTSATFAAAPDGSSASCSNSPQDHR
jgi:hypothetical protein